MRRFTLPEREGWEQEAIDRGYNYHLEDGLNWSEGVCYAFSSQEVETNVKAPSGEIHKMCLEAVDAVLRDEQLMRRMGIPEAFWSYIVESWQNDRERHLLGSMDFIYDGTGPARLLEYNADNPSFLHQAAPCQEDWLFEARSQGLIDGDKGQFNQIYDAIASRFKVLFPEGGVMHIAPPDGASESYMDAEYLMWAAQEAGVTPYLTYLQQIGLSEDGEFLDGESRVIRDFLKPYPWEYMLRDAFGEHIPASHCRMIEPAWKLLMSNKGILPVLWKMFPDHPNLLECYFEEDLESGVETILAASFVTKPIYSRGGSSVEIYEDGELSEHSEPQDNDGEDLVVQAYAPPPVLEEWMPVISTWVVGDECAGMSVREDKSSITQYSSPFVPHIVEE